MVKSHAAALPDVANANMLTTIWATTRKTGGGIKRIALNFAEFLQ